MSDTPVFMVVNLSEITDAAAYRTYEKGFFPILKKPGDRDSIPKPRPLQSSSLPARPQWQPGIEEVGVRYKTNCFRVLSRSVKHFFCKVAILF